MAVALAGAAPRAGAQESHDPGDEDVVHGPPPPPAYVARLRAPGRAVVGLDFGIGLLDAVCGGCFAEGGISLDVYAGAQLAPRVALVVDAWSLFHLIAAENTGGPGVAAHAIATAGARVWLVPRLWVQAGLGGGGLLIAGGPGDGGADFGPAAMFAVGGELGHKQFSGIDLSIRIGGSRVRVGSDPTDAGGSGDRVLVYSVAAVAGYHWN